MRSVGCSRVALASSTTKRHDLVMTNHLRHHSSPYNRNFLFSRLFLVTSAIFILIVATTNELVLAAPMFGRPPEDVVCLSNRLYGLVEDPPNSRHVDRTTWLTVDVFSSSPQDCIKQCYGYRFCYSVRYTFTESSQPVGHPIQSSRESKTKTCRFFLHVSDRCANQKLTSIDEIPSAKNSGDIFVDCLKCADEDEAKEEHIEGENYIKKSQPYYVTSHPKIDFNQDENPKIVQKQADWLVIQRDQVNADTEANRKFHNTINEAQKEEQSASFARTSAPAYATACLVTFQVFKQAPLNRLRLTKVATVSSLNECAYICYQNACTHAIYEPSSNEEAGTSPGEAKCSLEIGEKETCDNNLQRHYSFKTTRPVVLSCLRCGPKRPVTVSHEAEWVTSRPSSLVSSLFTSSVSQTTSTVPITVQAPSTTPEIASNTLSETIATSPTSSASPTPPLGVEKEEGVEKLTDVPNSNTTASSLSTSSSTNPSQNQPGKTKNGPTIKLENGCFTTFQGNSLSDRPKEFNSVFELELEAESVEVCAQKCYQDGCTGALYHAANSTCVLGYGDKYWCKNDSPETAKYRPSKPPLQTIWIHCVGCRNEVNRKTGVVETSIKDKVMQTGGELKKTVESESSTEASAATSTVEVSTESSRSTDAPHINAKGSFPQPPVISQSVDQKNSTFNSQEGQGTTLNKLEFLNSKSTNVSPITTSVTFAADSEISTNQPVLTTTSSSDSATIDQNVVDKQSSSLTTIPVAVTTVLDSAENTTEEKTYFASSKNQPESSSTFTSISSIEEEEGTTNNESVENVASATNPSATGDKSANASVSQKSSDKSTTGQFLTSTAANEENFSVGSTVSPNQSTSTEVSGMGKNSKTWPSAIGKTNESPSAGDNSSSTTPLVIILKQQNGSILAEVEEQEESSNSKSTSASTSFTQGNTPKEATDWSWKLVTESSPSSEVEEATVSANTIGLPLTEKKTTATIDFNNDATSAAQITTKTVSQSIIFQSESPVKEEATTISPIQASTYSEDKTGNVEKTLLPISGSPIAGQENTFTFPNGDSSVETATTHAGTVTEADQSEEMKSESINTEPFLTTQSSVTSFGEAEAGSLSPAVVVISAKETETSHPSLGDQSAQLPSSSTGTTVLVTQQMPTIASHVEAEEESVKSRPESVIQQTGKAKIASEVRIITGSSNVQEESTTTISLEQQVKNESGVPATIATEKEAFNPNPVGEASKDGIPGVSPAFVTASPGSSEEQESFSATTKRSNSKESTTPSSSTIAATDSEDKEKTNTLPIDLHLADKQNKSTIPSTKIAEVSTQTNVPITKENEDKKMSTDSNFLPNSPFSTNASPPAKEKTDLNSTEQLDGTERTTILETSLSQKDRPKSVGVVVPARLKPKNYDDEEEEEEEVTLAAFVTTTLSSLESNDEPSSNSTTDSVSTTAAVNRKFISPTAETATVGQKLVTINTEAKANSTSVSTDETITTSAKNLGSSASTINQIVVKPQKEETKTQPPNTLINENGNTRKLLQDTTTVTAITDTYTTSKLSKASSQFTAETLKKTTVDATSNTKSSQVISTTNNPNVNELSREEVVKSIATAGAAAAKQVSNTTTNNEVIFITTFPPIPEAEETASETTRAQATSNITNEVSESSTTEQPAIFSSIPFFYSSISNQAKASHSTSVPTEATLPAVIVVNQEGANSSPGPATSQVSSTPSGTEEGQTRRMPTEATLPAVIVVNEEGASSSPGPRISQLSSTQAQTSTAEVGDANSTKARSNQGLAHRINFAAENTQSTNQLPEETTVASKEAMPAVIVFNQEGSTERNISSTSSTSQASSVHQTESVHVQSVTPVISAQESSTAPARENGLSTVTVFGQENIVTSLSETTYTPVGSDSTNVPQADVVKVSQNLDENEGTTSLSFQETEERTVPTITPNTILLSSTVSSNENGFVVSSSSSSRNLVNGETSDTTKSDFITVQRLVISQDGDVQSTSALLEQTTVAIPVLVVVSQEESNNNTSSVYSTTQSSLTSDTEAAISASSSDETGRHNSISPFKASVTPMVVADEEQNGSSKSTTAPVAISASAGILSSAVPIENEQESDYSTLTPSLSVNFSEDNQNSEEVEQKESSLFTTTSSMPMTLEAVIVPVVQFGEKQSTSSTSFTTIFQSSTLSQGISAERQQEILSSTSSSAVKNETGLEVIAVEDQQQNRKTTEVSQSFGSSTINTKALTSSTNSPVQVELSTSSQLTITPDSEEVAPLLDGGEENGSGPAPSTNTPSEQTSSSSLISGESTTTLKHQNGSSPEPEAVVVPVLIGEQQSNIKLKNYSSGLLDTTTASSSSSQSSTSLAPENTSAVEGDLSLAPIVLLNLPKFTSDGLTTTSAITEPLSESREEPLNNQFSAKIVEETEPTSKEASSMTTSTRQPEIVRAVSQLIDVLVRKSTTAMPADGGEELTREKPVVEVAQIIDSVAANQQNFEQLVDEQQKKGELTGGKQKDNLAGRFKHKGITTKCKGRVEFQTSPVASLPRLNISNDVPADSPADCARKCLEKEGCTLAGFIPTPGHDSASGVCLLTTDEPSFECEVKDKERSDFTSQHASTVPFLISCVRCSDCNYSLSLASPDRELPQFNLTLPVATVGECARKCSKRHCSYAQFDPNTLNCSLSFQPVSKRQSNTTCAVETALQTNGIFPVILDCVLCVSEQTARDASTTKSFSSTQTTLPVAGETDDGE